VIGISRIRELGGAKLESTGFRRGGARLERRRRDDRGAEVNGGMRCGERVFASPLGKGLGGGRAPSPENFQLLISKILSFRAL